MVRHPPVEGISHVAPFRNRPAYRSLVRRCALLCRDRRQRRNANHPDRLTAAPRSNTMNRSIIIALAAFSTTILLIVSHTGSVLA